MDNKDISILFVDDDKLIRENLPEILQEYLRPTKITFQIVSSGNKAMRLIEEGLRFDIVISDYHMNDGSGADLLKYFHEHEIELPIIIYSSEQNPHFSFVSKKFLGVVEKEKIHELGEVIRQICG